MPMALKWSMSKKGACKIMDISPNGLRIYTQFQISIDQLKQVEMQFVLDESPIQIIGEFVWTKEKMMHLNMALG